ncbi:MAG: helix-turn-helix transcriptional regulator [Lachnospiraceae bacterium]|nr:helix-turn-helix transcriptional regulator [Lachnospiraceae bacterium]
MQIKLGEKIKELRKRDGRKQEDLANALGVTAQAVSRWESNGGYPDMSMIPAIANYFHTTIDALFGYNNDRDKKIKDYIQKGNRLLTGNDSDIAECICFMKEALVEFPAEPELQMCLAYALKLKGLKETDKPNIYLKEAAYLYEELSKQNNDVIIPLLDTYSMMGEYDKAEKKALEQPKVRMSREVLLAPLFNEKNGKQYQGEAILSLLHELRYAIEFAVTKNEKLANSKEGIDILLSIHHLYERIFGEKCYGKFHSDFCMNYLSCARIACNIKDYDNALKYFDSAFIHYTNYLELQHDECFKNDHFDAPLLTSVNNTAIPVVMLKSEYFKDILSCMPEDISSQIRTNSRYITLFN